MKKTKIRFQCFPILTEQPWFDCVFGYFTNNVNSLPFDHHMLMAMVAPRGLLSIDNPIDWLGPESSQVDCVAAKEVWKALGKDPASIAAVEYAHA